MAEQQQRIIEQRLRTGIQAAQQGDKARARGLLEQVIQDDSNNELAWIWMTAVVDSTQQKRVCLQKVLQLNPDNRPAQQALNSMVGILDSDSSGNIDYRAMTRASKTKLTRENQNRDDSFRGQLERGQVPLEEGEGRNNQIRNILGVIAIILAVILLGSLLPFVLPDEPEPTPIATNTPRPVVIQPTDIPASDTPDPNAGIAGNLVERATFTPGPTETPLPTQTPSITPTATNTLPPVESYDLLVVAEADGTANLYRYTLGGDIQQIGSDIRGVDYEDTQNQIVFLRENDGTQAFVGGLSNPASAESITRLPEGANAKGVTLSPDGTRAIYVSDQDGDDDLYVYDLSTGVARNITQTDFSDIDPQWVNDNLVVFASDRESPFFYEIFTLDLRGNVATRVTDTNGSNTQPSLSPDGQQVAYVNQLGSEAFVIVANLDGRRSRRASGASDVLESNPEWTSDGVYVTFVSRSSQSEDSAGQIYIARPAANLVEIYDIGLNVTEVLPIAAN